jgi:translation initiation factor IF-2
MADLSITDLAKMVGVPVERLLEQIKEAGLPQTNPADTITNEQRSVLLAFLKSRHGDTSGGDTAPRKITLKRKTVETLKSSDQQGRTKAVNVEVRKKRTYVKRSVEEAQQEAERERLLAEEKAREEAEQKARQAAAEAARAEANGKAVGPAGRMAGAPDSTADGKPDVKPDHKVDHKKGTLRKDSGRPEEEDAVGRKTPSRKKEKEKEVPPKKFTRVRSPEDFILDDDGLEGGARRRGRKKLPHAKQHQFEKPTEFISREIEIPEAITVGDLAQRMSLKSGELIKALMKMGVMATLNHILDQDTSVLLVEELGHKGKTISSTAIEDERSRRVRRWSPSWGT